MSALHLQGLRSPLFGPIDLRIDAGELALLSGPSGAGKSLLLRAIADLDPSRGEVSIDAVERSQIPPSTWRRRVGLLPAEPGWWADRVGAHLPSEHLADGHLAGANPVAARSTTLALLAELGFGPEVLDWEIARLSTGERQRLALARMLLMQPDVLLLDEPTANLDPDNRARVEALLGHYRDEHQAAVLWVSHDPDQRARLGGRDLHIAAGRLSSAPESAADTWN